MQAEPIQAERDQVKAICDDIQKRKKHWEKDFQKMRRYQAFVKKGASKDWNGHTVNIAARHVRDWTSSLYARRPRTIFRKRPKMEFTIWDESAGAIQKATETLALMDPMAAAAAGGMPPSPEEVAQAQALLQDAVQGLSRRQVMDKIGRTATLLYDYFMDEQMHGSRQPAKRMIRRALTAGVSYVRPGFQRVTERTPDVARQLGDAKRKLDEIQRRARALDEGDMKPDSPEAIELQQMIEGLEAMPQIVVREGLTLHYPASTAIIPDCHMTDILGFEGCERVAEEFILTKEAVEATYGVRIDKFNPYTKEGAALPETGSEGMCVVWMDWNIRTGLVHTVCDGFEGFLTTDHAPPIEAEGFWPWIPFAPNPSEDPDQPWPLSEVEKIMDACMEINRAQHGLAEARWAARPGTIGVTAIDDKNARRIEERKPGEHITMEGLSAEDLKDGFMPFPSPPIDPNVFATGPFVQEIELVTGVSEARFDAASRVSATAVSISEAGHTANVNSIRDELDDIQSQLARMCGQILMREMSQAQVKRIVGPGAVWPELDMTGIAEELHLEVEFGSSGYPNQAQRVSTLRDLGQLLLQIPGVVPERLAKMLLEAVDQNADLADFFDSSILTSIAGMNRMMTGQGMSLGGGADNAPAGPGPASTEPATVA